LELEAEKKEEDQTQPTPEEALRLEPAACFTPEAGGKAWQKGRRAMAACLAAGGYEVPQGLIAAMGLGQEGSKCRG